MPVQTWFIPSGIAEQAHRPFKDRLGEEEHPGDPSLEGQGQPYRGTVAIWKNMPDTSPQLSLRKCGLAGACHGAAFSSFSWHMNEECAAGRRRSL